MPPIETAELLRTYVSQRDEEAFRAVVERYLPLVYSTALRQVGGNTTLAEEISQDVFVALARKCAALIDKPTLAPWLFRATRLSAVNRLRGEQRRLEREQKAYLMEQIETRSEKIDWERTRPLLDSLLGQLAHRDQEALLMRFFEARTFPEIAQRLGISEDGARQLSNRAVDKLAALLSRRGIQSTAAVLAEVLATQHAGAVPAGLSALAANGALAGAVTASGAFATTPLLISIMKTSHLVMGALAIFALTGLGSAVREARLHRTTQAALQALRQERTALGNEIGPPGGGVQRSIVQHSSHSKDTELLRPSGGVVPPSGSASVASTPRATNAAAPSSIASLLSQIDHVLAHPELRPLFVAQIVQQLAGNDQRFFQSQGISAEQQAAIRQEAATYANMLLDARAKRVGGEDFTDLFSAGDEYSFNQVKRILGDEAFQQLKQYKTRESENSTVDRLAARLYFTDSPLTGEQANLLTEILVQNKFSSEPNSRPATRTVAGQPVSAAEHSAFRSAQHRETRSVLITDAIITQAQESLPPPTVDALRNLQINQLAQIKLKHEAPLR